VLLQTNLLLNFEVKLKFNKKHVSKYEKLREIIKFIVNNILTTLFRFNGYRTFEMLTRILIYLFYFKCFVTSM
jgi:hypothetical protein